MASDVMEAPISSNWQGANVDATTIERHLASLWKDVTLETAHAGAVRTNILNLVVYVPSSGQAQAVKSDLGNSKRHPSRTIVLIAERQARTSSIDAAAQVYCTDRGLGVPLCYEEINITAHGPVADHLDSVVIPLLISELPTYLWWPGQPPFGHRIFNRMISIANQLVIDSAQFNAPGDGFAHLARMCEAHQGVNDFNWGRLAPWRDVIAQFFDGAAWEPYVMGLRSVRLRLGSGEAARQRGTATVLLLAGWLASRLRWQPESTLDMLGPNGATITVAQGDRLIDIEVDFEDCGDAMAGRLTGVEIVSQPHNLPPARFTVERLKDTQQARTTVKVHEGVDLERILPFLIEADSDLLTRELEQHGHDPLYEAVVDRASHLAGRELWTPA